MRYLTDKEILSWNDRLKNLKIRVGTSASYSTGYPYLTFFEQKNQLLTESVISTDISTSFEFSFSVVEGRKNEFHELLKYLLSFKIGTKVCYKDDFHKEKFFEIDLDVLNKNVSSNAHEVLNRDFIRYKYTLNGLLSHIIAYITILEDAINFFQKIWGYNDKGEEICLLQFPIGTIVSLKKDTTLDYLVIDYKYIKTNDDYIIDYIVSEMNFRDSIIEYKSTYTFRENELVHNRNNRIDNILMN